MATRYGWDGSGRVGPNDQRFIVMMIPHHEVAIAMAEVALSRAHRPEIKAPVQRTSQSQSRMERMVHHHRIGVMMDSMALNTTKKSEIRQIEQSMNRVQSDEIQQMVECIAIGTHPAEINTPTRSGAILFNGRTACFRWIMHRPR